MNQEKDTLQKMSKDSGFTVPENYFDNFASEMMEKLPERSFKQEAPPTLWQKTRPLLYMAAMFLGVFLMFRTFAPQQKDPVTPQATATSEGEDSLLEEYIYTTSVNDYAVYEYLFTQYADAN